MTAQGDLIIGGASGTPERLPRGNAGQVLMCRGATVGWGSSGGEDASTVALAYSGDFYDGGMYDWHFVDPDMTVSQCITGIRSGEITAFTFTIEDSNNTLTCYLSVPSGWCGNDAPTDPTEGEGEIYGTLYTMDNKCFIVTLALSWSTSDNDQISVSFQEIASHSS